MGRTSTKPDKRIIQSGDTASHIENRSDTDTDTDEFTGIDSPTPTTTGTEFNQPAEESADSDTANTSEQPRRRGRPAGSTNKEKITLGVEGIKTRKVGRPTKEPERKLYTPDEAKVTTGIILAIVEGLAVSMLGNEAQFNSIEKTLLEESIPKLLERMSVTTAERTANVLYPGMIGFAGISYGIRLIQINKARQNNIPNNIQADTQEYYQDNSSENKSNGHTSQWGDNPNWLDRTRPIT